jgi:aspartate/tyrosine/aromatic aminotransferase
MTSNLDKEYLPQRGNDKMCQLAQRVLLGADSPVVARNQAVTVQSLSGTGGLRVAADFIAKHFNNPLVLVSSPTWGPHHSICAAAGLKTSSYRYWHASERRLDIDGFLDDIKAAPKGSLIILHACAHNPTGVDPTREQWSLIADAVRAAGLIPWFDSAYQGFASGSLETDAYAIRLFAQQGFEMFICQSFAKNFGLYGERVGTVTVIAHDPATHAALRSQLDVVIRNLYSNPPLHGARIVETVLASPELTQSWHDEMVMMSQRIKDMRDALRGHLVKLGTPGNWDHIVSQIGMFSFTGMTEAQSELMMSKHHVYMLKNGRISMAGVTSKNVEYIAKAMDDVIRNNKAAL